MKISSFIACGALCLASWACCSEQPLELHYNKPATYFEEALPLGNGRLGAMVYGDPCRFQLSLNDITLWTGEPDRGLEEPVFPWVEKVREALEAQDYPQADALQTHLQGHFSESYQPLGKLLLRFPEAQISQYNRSLKLADATATVSCLKDGKAFEAQCFVSAPDYFLPSSRTRHRPPGIPLSATAMLPITLIPAITRRKENAFPTTPTAESITAP